MNETPEQCPACGRVSENWGETVGLKGRRRADHEDRVVDYRRWRWELGDGLYVGDVDQIEYRLYGNTLVPVALLELSRVDGNRPVPPAYLAAVLDRFCKRDLQARFAKLIATRLCVKVWIVLFRWDLTEFWVYNLTDERGWWNLSPSKYRAWLSQLREDDSDA